MTKHEIVSEQQWLEARRVLLAEEKAWTIERDRLAARRRALPWVKIKNNYVFEGVTGPVTTAIRMTAGSDRPIRQRPPQSEPHHALEDL